MDDILFGNNNQATINRLAKRSYRANKQRNVFVTIALFLTAFMITSVFSLGCSYFETYQMQQIRAMGTTADVAITSLSEEQYEELSRSSLVSVVGVSQRLGSIDTSGMDDALLSITWIDETEWQEHRVPTISDIHGDYPQAKNEIMLPTWALRAMGIDDPQIGMNISLSYQLGTDYQYSSDEFVLSGYLVAWNGDAGEIMQTITRREWNDETGDFVPVPGSETYYGYPFTTMNRHAVFSAFPCPY